jgi:ankyrin repeat protein
MATTDRDLVRLMKTIGAGDEPTATKTLAATPELATAQLEATAAEFFLAERLLQVYAGDTALHVTAATYDTKLARRLVAAGADVRARNRRGAEPLHSAVNGVPDSSAWDPRRQAAVIRYLVSAGADPEATAAGGVTPLHRAVRNRCAAAVRALLDAGADPHRRNDGGSSAIDLAHQTTGRGGTGEPAAKAQQAEIIRLLNGRAPA